MIVVSPYLTFPNISWWAQVLRADVVIFDAEEHFQKMTFRNRYRISGANNSILLSVPLVNGRNQHVTMKDVNIFNGDRWQIQHWRTLVSVYRRTPFFEHYEDQLKVLFETPFTGLIDFNKAGIEFTRKQLRLGFEMQQTETFQKEYPAGTIDLRNSKFIDAKGEKGFSKYYQVFEDRIGFQPNLSVLDLLFSEGPRSADILRQTTILTS